MANTTTKITDKTKVKVFNNRGGKVGFPDINGKFHILNVGGMELVKYEDLENLQRVSPAFLDEGFIFIGDKYVREQLGLDYTNVIQYRHIESIINDYTLDQLKELGKTLDEGMKLEFGNVAYKMRMGLPLAKLKYLQEISKLELTDIEE